MVIDGYNHGITLIRRDMGPLFFTMAMAVDLKLAFCTKKNSFSHEKIWGSKIMNHWSLESWGLQIAIPSGYVKIAIEHGHRNSGMIYPLKMVIFNSYVSHYQRVHHDTSNFSRLTPFCYCECSCTWIPLDAGK